jgi:iron-sulfur cluster assembly accessory protein
MLKVTEKATEMIKDFFKNHDKIEPLRIFVAGMGCSGPMMGLALDEACELDTTFEQDGLTFIVATDLIKEAQPIEVDYIITPSGEGFFITHALKNPGGCGGCTGCEH